MSRCCTPLQYRAPRRGHSWEDQGPELLSCGPPGTRTLNLRIKSPQLCH
jgi:hypothetical protein